MQANEELVQASAHCTANDRSYNGDPPVGVVQSEDLRPKVEGGGDARSQVTGRVDSIARLHTEGHANT
eukprot:CAMPEP_0206493404 /NCGR_PEP_ID=MMETSP0324_2-20121206/46936_1 /ASSEMBLY_ACC=CAM_ASM_000836 /TAXON_ID=2866 /ORGANISM="Crypthecodinium cohnii, Strain Seligo" /LENGTH=67 /DNA_ID=CAMNT_0053976509 /DNA_START=339 /DNA_END=538 /DNA_ORIENTATION=+